MQLQQLIYFVTVAEQGSINKAAEKLFITQPNLSKAISNLENELKVRVFNRTNKGVALTDGGKKLYQYARTILNQMELIQGLSQKERPRILSVAAYPIITMGRLAAEFHNAHRQDNIEIKLVEQRLQNVMESVEGSHAEIGFVMVNNAQLKEFRHTVNYKDLEFHLLGKDTWYLNVGPHSPFYDRKEVYMEELLDATFVRLPDDYFSNLTHYLEIGGIHLGKIRRKLYVSDSAALLALLRQTDVIRFGPALSAPDFAEYGIHSIPVRNSGVEISVGWLQRKRELLTPEAEEFVGLLKGLFPSPGAADPEPHPL